MTATLRRALVAMSILLLAVAPSPASAGGQTATGDIAHDAGLQWGFDRIHAAGAWSTTRGDGATIAIIDSGVAIGHEDLAANVIAGTACQDTDGDPAACTGDPADDDGHGTHVAGIAAAVAGNEVGIAGVAPEAWILPVKVLHAPCPGCPVAGNAGDVAAAVRWATDEGADVINLSLGSTTSTVFGEGFIDAIEYAWAGGAIPVVAAGNQLVLTADFGDAPAVVVSAIDRDEGSPSYANGVGAARWAVAAPGGESDDTPESCSQTGDPVGILSTFWAPDDDTAYACLSGTSMAAPHVSGGLALLRSAGLDPSQAVQTLLDTAVDIGPPGYDPEFGVGLVDLAAAAAAVPSVEATTSPTIQPPPPVDGVDGPVAAPPNETSSPQVFVPIEDDELPILPVAIAVTGVLATAFVAVELFRRRMI